MYLQIVNDNNYIQVACFYEAVITVYLCCSLSLAFQYWFSLFIKKCTVHHIKYFFNNLSSSVTSRKYVIYNCNDLDVKCVPQVKNYMAKVVKLFFYNISSNQQAVNGVVQWTPFCWYMHCRTLCCLFCWCIHCWTTCVAYFDSLCWPLLIMNIFYQVKII